MRHLENSGKVMLATGLIVAYGYGIEAFMGWYSGNTFDSFLLWNRLHGPYAPWYWSLLASNIFIPQLLWIKKFRTSTFWLWVISLIVLAGMWLERFIIIVVSLPPRFPEFVLGYVLPDQVGLDDLHRYDRHVPDLHVAVCARAADGIDRRVADPFT